ncbi:hypothetical protein Aduo_012057 [Ancylostoma duodenale]
MAASLAVSWAVSGLSAQPHSLTRCLSATPLRAVLRRLSRRLPGVDACSAGGERRGGSSSKKQVLRSPHRCFLVLLIPCAPRLPSVGDVSHGAAPAVPVIPSYSVGLAKELLSFRLSSF